jgi:hypothetical protein
MDQQQLEEVRQLQADVRQGEDARQSLRGLIPAFEALRKDLTNQMSAVKPLDEKTKSKLIDMWQLVDGLENWFRKSIESGEYASLQLEERRKFNLFKRAG